MAKTYEYGELDNKAKQVALKQYLERSLVLNNESHGIGLAAREKKIDPEVFKKQVAESHLLYSSNSKYERFDQQGKYLGLFDVHEESVSMDY